MAAKPNPSPRPPRPQPPKPPVMPKPPKKDSKDGLTKKSPEKKTMPGEKKNQDKLKSTMPYIKGPGTPPSEKKPMPYKKETPGKLTPADKKKFQLKKKGM